MPAGREAALGTLLSGPTIRRVAGGRAETGLALLGAKARGEHRRRSACIVGGGREKLRAEDADESQMWLPPAEPSRERRFPKRLYF